MTPAFAHPCLVVPNLEIARKFYQAMFGFEDMAGARNDAPSVYSGGTSTEIPALHSCMMKGRNCCLELKEDTEFTTGNGAACFRDGHEPGIRHLTFYVDDCWAGYKRFLALGGFAMGIPTGDTGQGYSVYCRDPFGNITELIEVPKQGETLHEPPEISSLVR